MDTSLLLEEWYEVNPYIEKNLEEFYTDKPLKRKTVPTGYSWNGESKLCDPDPEVLNKIIELVADSKWKGVRSLADARGQLNMLLDQKGMTVVTTDAGMSNILKRAEKKLGIFRGTSDSADRLKEHRRKRLQERRAEGRKRPYHFSKEEQKRVDQRKKLTEKNQELVKLKEKERRLKAAAARHAAKLKLKGDPIEESREELRNKRPKSIHKDTLDVADIPKDREVAFRPNPGPQTEFLSASEDIVLYGGAAGGGKSYAMVVDPLRYAHKSKHRAVLIRKTMPELKEIIDVSRELYPKYDPKAKYRESDHTWTFSSGAQIMFRFLERPADKFRFQGIAYTYIGFDELSQHETPEGFNYLRSRLRSATDPDSDDGINCYVRATANPGSMWVYEMFIKDKEPNKTYILEGTEHTAHPTTIKFIPAKLEDNPYLDIDGKYRSVLQSLDETLRRQLLEGDWLAANDNMFNEFSIETHVIDPFPVPRHWNRVAGLDYGYKDPSAAVWFAIDPEDGSIVVYDEFLQPGLTGREFALSIKDREQEELITVDHPIDWSIYARTGHSGPTIAESMLSVPGFRIRKADKNREAGWVQVHELLRADPRTGMPKMRVFSNCKNLIKQLMSCKVHPNKPGDIDQTRNSDGHWDLLDALRYGVMSRPRTETYEESLIRHKQYSSWNKYRGYFS